MSDVTRTLNATLADRYRIERELGQGGMATVYLAHDVRHDRDVALKVLHPDLGAALGGERFLAEIRTTARLQHPHILPLLDSGEADGLLYYVMPFVRGETLRSRLERERQLPVDDAIRITREVADALGHAHGLGIIHRDIKPENILLQGGHASVADFGIALAVQQAGGQRMTQTGLSLGTPQYMSPEQAMGEKTIDVRSDLYALGAVAYEMLVGEPPFTGPTVQTIVAKVLTERPTAPRTLRDTVPPGVEAAVLKALAKLPADRFTSVGKFVEALDRPDVAVGAPRPDVVSPPTDAPVARSRATTRIAAVIAALAIGAIGWWLGHRSAPNRQPEWSGFTQLTDASGVETSPSLSPDGQSFAYASAALGSWDIYVQRVGGHNPVIVAGDTTLDEMWPAYSPDGRQIAYSVRGGGIFLVGATGESPRRLTSVGSNPAWSPDGKTIAYGTEEVASAYNVNGAGALWTVDVSGGEPKRIDRGEPDGFYQPAWSPSGQRLVFWTTTNGQRDLETIDLAARQRVKLTDDVAVDFAPVWAPDGRSVYFASDRGGTMGLWRMGVDEVSGRPTSAPELIASGVDVEMDLPHLSSDGTSLIFRSKLESVNPARIAFDPIAGRITSVTLLQQRTGVLVPTDASPDGKWLSLGNIPDRQQDIFVMRTDGSGLTRLTDDIARDFTPRFTPDGASLTFFSNQTGKYEVWSMKVDGSARTRLTDLANVTFSMFAPDGRLIVGRIPSGAVVGTPPWPATEKTVKPMTGLEVEGGTMTPTYLTRDGRWMSGYVVTTAGEGSGLAVYDVAAGRARRLNTDSRTYDVAWMPGGRHVVYFTDRGKLVMQDVVTLERRNVSGTLPYPPDLLGALAASRDGRSLYYGATQSQGNIWLVRRSGAVASIR
jgi:serine/threonine-protein kinase